LLANGNPPWKLLRAFDDGEKIHIQFLASIARGKLPTDVQPNVPELALPLPSHLGSATINSQQPVATAYTTPAHDPADALRKEAEAAATSSVFFRASNQE